MNLFSDCILELSLNKYLTKCIFKLLCFILYYYLCTSCRNKILDQSVPKWIMLVRSHSGVSWDLNIWIQQLSPQMYYSVILKWGCQIRGHAETELCTVAILTNIREYPENYFQDRSWTHFIDTQQTLRPSGGVRRVECEHILLILLLTIKWK